MNSIAIGVAVLALSANAFKFPFLNKLKKSPTTEVEEQSSAWPAVNFYFNYEVNYSGYSLNQEGELVPYYGL